MTIPLDQGVARALGAIEHQTIDHVFFVACGGSLSIMHPAKFMLDQASASLASDVYNAAEFISRGPRRLGPNSLVVLCSMTGTTRETVAATQFAKKAGAMTVVLTTEGASPLAKAGDYVIEFEAPYTTGTPIDAKNSNYARIYQLVLGLARHFDGNDQMDLLLSSLEALQPAIDRAHERFAPLFADFAPRFAGKNTIYTMASGASYGAAYSFSICVLMEMQWINSQAIHANEFFHGPFEVLDKEAAFVLFKGFDSTRPLEERAEGFLQRFGAAENIMVLDAKNLDLQGIASEFRGNLVPLIFFDTLWRFAYKIADLRDHEMLEGRRYMKKLSDY
ncbi:SIS domain-containing protein [Paracoccus rhizosphaerae]|uniref:SIS domain-containing protein n=1 Tax=Paracoccus rhizosphaerae TaxID=1133347 RepID=A0ABV6CMU3_9RHOB|nr:SIS domain-containing protein [Paracoccus rhizosphaerae]